MRFLALAVAILAVARGAFACTTPVFRYALERWPASPYEILVIHPKTTPPDAALLESINRAGAEGRVNAVVSAIDLGSKVDPHFAPLVAAESPSGPALLACYPDQGSPVVAWRAPLDAENVAALLRSPAREELFRRLTAGDAIVFLVLTSGDAGADAAAATTLTAALENAKSTIKLPERPPDDNLDPASRLRASLPLRLQFSSLNVASNAAEERAFVAMLRNAFDIPPSVPAVVPVFGRGRALDAMHGEHLTNDQILEAAEFLSGACSCQVKQFNPGVDLLIEGDWDRIFGTDVAAREEAPPTPAKTIILESVASHPAAVAPAADVSGPQHDSRRVSTLLAAGWAVSALLVILFGWLAWRHRTRSAP
jgi:hypothetical protein